MTVEPPQPPSPALLVEDLHKAGIKDDPALSSVATCSLSIVRDEIDRSASSELVEQTTDRSTRGDQNRDQMMRRASIHTGIWLA